MIRFLFLAMTAFAATAAGAQPLGPLDWDREASPFHGIDRDRNLVLRSEATDEDREITVRLPAGYADDGDARYPVLYVTDADWNYRLVADYVDYLSYFGRIPETIVVGIRNVDRNRDFVPRPSPSFPNTGEAEAFAQFVAGELKPAIDERYRTAGFDTLFGHSFGGVITSYMLFTQPDAFDAYIALSTSTWVADRALFEEAERFFASGSRPDIFYYMAVAEADGGATVPDGTAFAALFEQSAPDSIEWHYDIVPGTNHFTVVMPALADALQRLYPAWGFEAELEQRLAAEGEAAIAQWFATKERELGPRFYPQAMELGLLGIRLAASGEAEAARALYARLRSEHPESAETLFMQALAENALGDPGAAAQWAERAYRLGREAGNVMPHRLTTYRNFARQWQAAANPAATED